MKVYQKLTKKKKNGKKALHIGVPKLTMKQHSQNPLRPPSKIKIVQETEQTNNKKSHILVGLVKVLIQSKILDLMSFYLTLQTLQLQQLLMNVSN